MVAVVCSTVGVPLIFPSEVPHVRPLGSEGLISHEMMAPPLIDGRFGVIIVPFVRVMFSGEYESELGAASLMVMLTWAEVEPPELLAQTVYVVAVVCSTDGVPLMAPVEVLKERPVGTEGLISHDVMVPPLTEGRFGVMAVPFVRVMFSGE